MAKAVRLKGVHKVTSRLADGSSVVYYYHRASKTKLEGLYGSAEFLASFAACAEQSASYIDGTINGLIRQFRKSPQWLDLRESTREIMALNLMAVEKKFGGMKLAALADKRTRPVILAWHDDLAQKTPGAADKKTAALARVLSWGIDRGIVAHNPAAGFHRALKSDRSDMIWLQPDIDALTKVAPPEICNAMILALHTGQRQGDLLALTWSGYDGNSLTLRQGKDRSKKSRRVYIPCTKALKSTLDALPRSKASLTILTRADGRCWTQDAFKNAWALACSKAGINDLHFHDLRGTAITNLSDAGCTHQEIAAITGHSLKTIASILDTYWSRTRFISDSAIRKLEEHTAKKIVK